MPHVPASPRLYGDLATLWPLLSPPDDYEPEAEQVRAVLHEHLGEPGPEERHSILELGAGGGHTLCHLAQEYEATAVDLSEPMLANCRALLGEGRVTTIVGDMRDLRLGRAFDAVLAHDAIDYMLTEADLLAALHTASAHLRPGGVLAVAPTYVAETFTDHDAAEDPRPRNAADVETNLITHVRRLTDTTIEMTLLILVREGGRLRVEHDRHVCGLFPAGRWLALIEQAGLTPVDSPDAGDDPTPFRLFVAVKPG